MLKNTKKKHHEYLQMFDIGFIRICDKGIMKSYWIAFCLNLFCLNDTNNDNQRICFFLSVQLVSFVELFCKRFFFLLLNLMGSK